MYSAFRCLNAIIIRCYTSEHFDKFKKGYILVENVHCKNQKRENKSRTHVLRMIGYQINRKPHDFKDV